MLPPPRRGEPLAHPALNVRMSIHERHPGDPGTTSYHRQEVARKFLADLLLGFTKKKVFVRDDSQILCRAIGIPVDAEGFCGTRSRPSRYAVQDLDFLWSYYSGAFAITLKTPPPKQLSRYLERISGFYMILRKPSRGALRWLSQEELKGRASTLNIWGQGLGSLTFRQPLLFQVTYRNIREHLWEVETTSSSELSQPEPLVFIEPESPAEEYVSSLVQASRGPLDLSQDDEEEDTGQRYWPIFY